MIKLFHTKGWGNINNAELIGTFDTKLKCKKAVDEFTKSLKEYYYSRVCDDDNGIVIDYGDYNNFLLVTGISYQDFVEPIRTCLWLDDERDPNGEIYDDNFERYTTWCKLYGPKDCDEVVWVKNYDEFVKYLETHEMPNHVCFDHDLGEGPTGYDAAKYLCNLAIEQHIEPPAYSCHSMNYVGKHNILMYMANCIHNLRNNVSFEYRITVNVDKEALESYPNYPMNYSSPEDWIESNLKAAFDVKGVTIKISK